MYIPEDLEHRIERAVQLFWSIRDRQIARQEGARLRERGGRGAVTGGKQLDGFIELIRDTLMLNGVLEDRIFHDADLELPGFYRPNKKWDLLVVAEGRLVAAIEFKSQVGPSFGNNFNNRTEEAIGSALDLWTAYREGVFGTQSAPWLGYFMLLEDCQSSSMPVRARSPHFDVLEEFMDTSYKERYEIFCRKLILERQYSAACLLTASRGGSIPSYSQPREELSCRAFITSLLGTVAAHMQGGKGG